jgi:hypothetical protein
MDSPPRHQVAPVAPGAPIAQRRNPNQQQFVLQPVQLFPDVDDNQINMQNMNLQNNNMQNNNLPQNNNLQNNNLPQNNYKVDNWRFQPDYQ